MHFCTDFNGKSLQFYTIAKIKVIFVLEIFVSLRYVMYLDMISEKLKTRGHRSYKKTGAVPNVRIGDKHCVCQDRENQKSCFQDMIMLLTYAMHLYIVCKNMT